MKSQAVDPIERIPQAGGAIEDDGPSIIELPSSGPLRAARNTDRWLGAVIAVCAAVVCLGFVGHSATASSPADVPVASQTPLPAAKVEAQVQEASEPSSQASQASQTTGIGSGELQGAISPVSIWHLEPDATGSGPVLLTIDGYAPSSIDSITVRVRSGSGTLLRSAVAHLILDDERPGSGGQGRRGLGRFDLRIVLARTSLVEGCLVETDWRDGTTGSQGSTTQVIPRIGG